MGRRIQRSSPVSPPGSVPYPHLIRPVLQVFACHIHRVTQHILSCVCCFCVALTVTHAAAGRRDTFCLPSGAVPWSWHLLVTCFNGPTCAPPGASWGGTGGPALALEDATTLPGACDPCHPHRPCPRVPAAPSPPTPGVSSFLAGVRLCLIWY